MTSNLYFTDNGAILCRAHLGATAAATGRDISGQRIQRVTDADRREWLRTVSPEPMHCERCPRPAVGYESRAPRETEAA